MAAIQNALCGYLVTYLEGGNVRADTDDLTAYLVTRRVRCNVVTALSGLAQIAVYVGTADTACLRLDQDLIGLELRHLYVFDSEVLRTIHKRDVCFHDFSPFLLAHLISENRLPADDVKQRCSFCLILFFLFDIMNIRILLLHDLAV